MNSHKKECTSIVLGLHRKMLYLLQREGGFGLVWSTWSGEEGKGLPQLPLRHKDFRGGLQCCTPKSTDLDMTVHTCMCAKLKTHRLTAADNIHQMVNTERE